MTKTFFVFKLVLVEGGDGETGPQLYKDTRLVAEYPTLEEAKSTIKLGEEKQIHEVDKRDGYYYFTYHTLDEDGWTAEFDDSSAIPAYIYEAPGPEDDE